MSGAEPARNSYGIGEVLAQLRAEFPDVSTSKIRFLEAEGLIEPARTRSGYRRFAAADIERLRYILTAQRDEYLPLRVIKERLQAGGPDGAAGARPTLLSALSAIAAAEGGTARGGAGRDRLLSRTQLLEEARIDAADLADLEDYGLVRRRGRHYDGNALAVARAAAALARFGLRARHLRAVAAAVDREITLIEQVVSPRSRQRDPAARDAAARDAWQIAAQILRLHATLVEAGLAEAGLAGRPGQDDRRRAGGAGEASGEKDRSDGWRSTSAR